MADAQDIANQTATDTDIFQTLQKQNQALIDVLNARSQNQPITYVQQANPTPVAAKAPNYLLYVGIGIGALFLLKQFKIKLF